MTPRYVVPYVGGGGTAGQPILIRSFPVVIEVHAENGGNTGTTMPAADPSTIQAVGRALAGTSACCNTATVEGAHVSWVVLGVKVTYPFHGLLCGVLEKQNAMTFHLLKWRGVWQGWGASRVQTTLPPCRDSPSFFGFRMLSGAEFREKNTRNADYAW